MTPPWACIPRQRGSIEGMFSYIALAKDKTWQPGPYAGVELMILQKNPATGGVVALRKFAAGAEMADDVTILVVRWHGNP